MCSWLEVQLLQSVHLNWSQTCDAVGTEHVLVCVMQKTEEENEKRRTRRGQKKGGGGGRVVEGGGGGWVGARVQGTAFLKG